MNEVQRQAYLKVMGIQTYFPKSILLGAKPSPAYEFPLETLQKLDPGSARQASAGLSIKPERSYAAGLVARVEKGIESRGVESRPAEGVKETSESAAKNAGIARVPRSLKPPRSESTAAISLAGSRLKQVNGEESKTLATSEESIVAEAENELRFKLRYFRISEKLAVIDEVPHQKSERLNAEDLVLLKAILAALKLDTGGVDFQPESFSWPLAAGLSMKNDPAEEAKRALSGFVQMRHETDRFANLLVFSAQVDSLLVRPLDGTESRDFAATNSNYFITVTSSLHSMLAYPALKREVWQQLQPLRRRLAESN
ncbi:MAG: hypothetical protein HQ498_06820 [Pseudohongiella sp.]|nr:hypothetical protein [Pseudohongiella sp.]